MKPARTRYCLSGLPEIGNMLDYAISNLPYQALREIRKVMDGSIVAVGHPVGSNFDAWNVQETEKGKEFSIALPGVVTDRISVKVSDKHVEVRVASQNSEDDSNDDIDRSRLYRFKLDNNADADAITAKAEHGVVKIAVPLRESETKREIAVEVVN